MLSEYNFGRLSPHPGRPLLNEVEFFILPGRQGIAEHRMIIPNGAGYYEACMREAELSAGEFQYELSLAGRIRDMLMHNPKNEDKLLVFRLFGEGEIGGLGFVIDKSGCLLERRWVGDIYVCASLPKDNTLEKLRQAGTIMLARTGKMDEKRKSILEEEKLKTKGPKR